MSDLDFLKKYEDLLNKDYCNCNEMNCIDNNSPRRILNIAKNQQKEIERLNNIIYREISDYILKKYGMLDDTHYHDFLNELELENEEKYKEIERLRKENQQLKEDIKFCINTMKNEYECTDKRTNRELHTMVEILEKWTKEYKEGSD